MQTLVFLIYAGCAVVISAQDERCPVKCDKERCANDVGSCNSTTLDDCQCCLICVRGLDEECGGVFGSHGVCQAGYECFLQPDQRLGICKDKKDETDCNSVVCPEISFECPWDSKYIESKRNSCCQVPGQCQCDPTRCNDIVCPPQFTKQLQSHATSTPGMCCDVYQCVPDSGPSGVCIDHQTGLKYESGQFWRQDECVSCTCYVGSPKCYITPCEKLTCLNPVKVEGECCPRCAGETECGPFKCDLDCGEGFYQYDAQNCPICQCKSNQACPKLSACPLKCPNGYKTDKSGCDTCNCHICPNIIKYCHLKCQFGFAKDARGCPICKCKEPDSNVIPHPKCYDTDSFYSDGEEWQPNPCTTCMCAKGEKVCNIVDCDHITCKRKVYTPGQCCPSCLKEQDCLDRNHILRNDGDLWNKSPCGECSCKNGTVSCTVKDCPSLQCSEHVYLVDQCCPVCTKVMQNIVQKEEVEFVIAIISNMDLKHITNIKTVFIDSLDSATTYSFTLKMIQSFNLKKLRKSRSNKDGSVVLVNAFIKNKLQPAASVVADLQSSRINNVVEVLTYAEFVALSERNYNEMESKLNVGTIVGIVVASLILLILLITYTTRRYIIISNRRKFKHAASMGQSADQLIHTVDNSRLTINFQRVRPSMDESVLSVSPSPSEVSPYHQVTGHDNLASSFNPLSENMEMKESPSDDADT